MKKKYIISFLTDSVEEFNSYKYPEGTWSVAAEFTVDEIKKLKKDKVISDRWSESIWRELIRNI